MPAAAYKNLELAHQQPEIDQWRTAPIGVVPARKLQLPEPDEVNRLHAPSGIPGYCVDEICVCGVHDCKADPHVSLPFEGETAYQSHYKRYALPDRQEPPLIVPPASLPFEGMSTYQSHYVPYRVELPPGTAPPIPPPSLAFEGTSTYQAHYVPQQLPPPFATPAPVAVTLKEDRDFRTQYRNAHNGEQPDLCPMERLPTPYMKQGRKHVFWDVKSKTWY